VQQNIDDYEGAHPLDLLVSQKKRITELEGIASCLLDSYVVSFASGSDALAVRAKKAIPNWRKIADEFNPTT
jgi:hypothetical protein